MIAVPSLISFVRPPIQASGETASNRRPRVLHRVETASLRLLREADPETWIVVPQLQAEAHLEDPSPMTETLFPAEYLEARAALLPPFPADGTCTRTRPRSGVRDDAAMALLQDLRARARDQGLWAPHVPPEAGGTGLGFLCYACLNEEIGRSTYAQLVFGCQAPDAGSAEILHLFGTDEQKERCLRPLVAGEVRSALLDDRARGLRPDPTLLGRAGVRDGDEWVIDGHKWFSSGADGAAFAVVFASPTRTPSASARRTMIVPADTPGVDVVRPVPVMGHAGRGWSTHSRCATRASASRSRTLGEEGDAFRSRRSGSARGASTT